MSFQNNWLRLGFFKFEKNWHVGMRAEVDHKDNIFLSFRHVWNKNKVNISHSGVFNLHNTSLTKMDGAVTYDTDKGQVSLSQ